jgi:hypothetical protein
MTDLDWFEALSPEAQKIAFVIEYSIAKSGDCPIDSERPQRRDLHICYLSQGIPCEVTKEVKIPVGPRWYVSPSWWTDKGKGSYAKREKILLPSEMAEVIVSDEHPDETIEVTSVIVSPIRDWAKLLLGTQQRDPSLAEAIIEVVDYYEASGRPHYGYPSCLLRECLRQCPSRYVLRLWDESKSETVVNTARWVLHYCLKQSSVTDLFSLYEDYKQHQEIAEQVVSELGTRRYNGELKKEELALLKLMPGGEEPDAELPGSRMG